MIEWRVVPSFPDYEVSETGDVRRCRKTWKGTQVGRVLRSHRRPDGYRMYILRRNNQSFHPRAHQLVAEAFIGPKPFSAAEICHNDGDASNDHWSTLRWDTRSANHRDKRRHGTDIGGERHHAARLTAAQVREIRARAAAGESQRAIGASYGLLQGGVSRIVLRKRWASIP